MYLDETCFTRRTVASSEWSLPKQNVRVDAAHLNEPTLAVLAAVSREEGLEHYQVYERSVNIPKYKGWLDQLRQKTGDDKICLFQDNLSAHTSDKSKQHMRSLNFRWVYNVPYSP